MFKHILGPKIIDYNGMTNKIIYSRYKCNENYTNNFDATVSIAGNNSTLENSGIYQINAGTINIGINSQNFSASTINIGSSLSTINIRGKLIFDNVDGLATNLPDFIRQVLRVRT